MAIQPINVNEWIPEDLNGPVITKIQQVSAIEGTAKQFPMKTLTRKVPRDGGMTFEGATPKSTAIAKDLGEADTVLLTARKFARIVELAEEDIDDTSTVADVVRGKQTDWAGTYAKGFDNACIGVTAAENGTTVPFTSIYRALTSNDTGLPAPEAQYNANDNVVVAASGGMTYQDASSLFSLLEESDWWDDGAMVIYAHPSFRGAFRELKDANQRPLFLENQTKAGDNADSLWGVPIKWTQGARTSAVSTNRPTGKPLMVLVNRNLVFLGPRSGPEYMFAGADSGPAFEVDDAMLKFRRRAGFCLAHPRAAAMLVGN